MKMKYREMIKRYAKKNNITEKEAKKIFMDFENFIVDYLSDVAFGDENIITPIKGLNLSSKRIRRSKSTNKNNESIVVKAEFNNYFKEKLNRDSCDYYSSLWFL